MIVLQAQLVWPFVQDRGYPVNISNVSKPETVATPLVPEKPDLVGVDVPPKSGEKRRSMCLQPKFSPSAGSRHTRDQQHIGYGCERILRSVPLLLHVWTR